MVVFVLGVISAASQAPFNFFPVLLVTIPLLILCLDKVEGRSIAPSGWWWRNRPVGGRVVGGGDAFLIGWGFGLGYFTAGLYWIGVAFFIEAERFAVLAPFCVGVLAAYLALYYGAACWIMRALHGDTRNIARLITLAVALSLMEWLRGHILWGGFPWNPLGSGFALSAATHQIGAWVGIHGASLLMGLIAVAPAAFFATGKDRRCAGYAYGGFALLLLVTIGLGGMWRLASADGSSGDIKAAAPVSLRLVQPNIIQREKMLPSNRIAMIELMLELSRNESSDARPLLIIWPEVALTFAPQQAPGLMAEIADLLPPESTLITGAMRFTEDTPSRPRRYNSIYRVDRATGFESIYDKVQLVPFGEFTPLRDGLIWLGFGPLVDFAGYGYDPGLIGDALTLPSVPPFQMAICYEIVFADLTHRSKLRPRWLLNLTNDAWFGNTSGPYQHLQHARDRAVESGRPVIRVANTGISAVIDSYGRILRALPLNERGVIDTILPEQTVMTLYAQYGDRLYAALVILLMGGVAGGGLWRFRRRTEL